jgi:hypothetical protein
MTWPTPKELRYWITSRDANSTLDWSSEFHLASWPTDCIWSWMFHFITLVPCQCSFQLPWLHSKVLFNHGDTKIKSQLPLMILKWIFGHCLRAQLITSPPPLKLAALFQHAIMKKQWSLDIKCHVANFRKLSIIYPLHHRVSPLKHSKAPCWLGWTNSGQIWSPNGELCL